MGKRYHIVLFGNHRKAKSKVADGPSDKLVKKLIMQWKISRVSFRDLLPTSPLGVFSPNLLTLSRLPQKYKGVARHNKV